MNTDQSILDTDTQMHYPEMEKVARKPAAERGWAFFPRCRLQPDGGRAAPTGTERGRKATRQKTEPLSLPLSFPISVKALNFLRFPFPGFFLWHA